MPDAKPYFLGEEESELRRLAFQAKAWRDITIRLCKDAGISAGARVVDLGCGPGFFTVELSSMVGPGGNVLAVDKSETFLAALESRAIEKGIGNISLLCHDIEMAASPANGFDFVFSRWLHPYVDDVAELVGKELRCLKPGGRTISLGTFNYQGASMAPWNDDFDLVTRKIVEFYKIGRRQINATNMLPALLCTQGAGLVILRDVSEVAQPHEDLWEWYRQFSFSMLPRLREAGLITESNIEAYKSVWEERSKTPGAFISVPSHLGVVAEKR